MNDITTLRNYNKYTQEQINFIKENYPLYGATYCSKMIDKPIHCIYPLISRYNIPKRGRNREKHPDLMNININQFLNIDKIETAYFLGFLWADGNIISYRNKKTNIEQNRISIGIVTEDANDILPIINNLGKWFSRTRQRQHWKEQTDIATNNRQLYNFLKDNDYHIKSIGTPTKILKLIPENLHHYFWRGYFDGDGCLYMYKTQKCISFCGSYEQEWTSLEILLKQLDIKYSIHRTVDVKRKSKCSKVLIQNKIGILNLISYFDPINFCGLKRKTNKMLEFIRLYSS